MMLRLLLARWHNKWLRFRLRGRALAPVARQNLSALDHLRLNQPAIDQRYVSLDVETTGLSRHRDRVVSISAVRIVGGRILLGDAFSSLVNPGRGIPSTTIKIHGIVPSMVDQAPALEEVLDQFLQYLGTDILVGYQVRFDLNFLNRCMKKKYGIRLQNLAIDVMDMCNKVVFPVHIRKYALRVRGPKNLDDMAAHFGIEIPERHTAFGDALAAAMIVQRVLAILETKRPARVRDLLSAGIGC